MFNGIAVAISIAVVNPYTLIIFGVCVIIMIMILIYSSRVLQESQRLDSLLRAPIHHAMATRYNGLISFRAFRQTSFMRKEFITSLEKAANATFCFVISNRWLAIRLDFVVLFFSISIAAFAVGFRAIYPSSLLAYTLQVTSDLIAFFSFSLRSFAELQNFMTSA